MKYVFQKNLNSFTYIEVIFVLLILSIICPMLPLLIKSISQFESISNYDNSELLYFTKDLTDDAKKYNKSTMIVDKYGKAITFKDETNSVTYKYKNNKIIKTRNNNGNITMLSNVIYADFKQSTHGFIKLNIILYDKGKHFEREIYF